MEIKKVAGICPVCKNRNHQLAPDVEGSICDKCQDKIAKTNAFVICKNCHKIAAVVKEGETPTGFIFDAGKFYTTNACVQCSPIVSKLIINELEEFENGQKSSK